MPSCNSDGMLRNRSISTQGLNRNIRKIEQKIEEHQNHSKKESENACGPSESLAHLALERTSTPQFYRCVEHWHVPAFLAKQTQGATNPIATTHYNQVLVMVTVVMIITTDKTVNNIKNHDGDNSSQQ